MDIILFWIKWLLLQVNILDILWPMMEAVKKFVLQLGIPGFFGSGYATKTSNIVITSKLLNKWNLLTVSVRRGGPTYGRKVHFYLNDGESIGEVSCLENSELKNTAELLIGKRFDNTGYFKGMMDELLIYKTPLTIEEIKKIYSAQHYGLCKNSNYIPCYP